jgi:tetratricopeptide (TPR) repeat protein
LINAARNAPKEVADAPVNRGQAAWYADKMKQAFADLDRAIALDPNNARAFRERSNAYRSIDKLDRALADASEAVRLDPRDAKAFDNRGDVFVDKGQYDRDPGLRRSAAARSETEPGVQGSRGRLLFQ